MERSPFESESIYDFDYLLAKRKATVKRGQTYNVDEEAEPARPLRRPKINRDSVKLPPIVVENKPPAGIKPAPRRPEVPNAAMMATIVQREPDWHRDSRRLTESSALYNTTNKRYGLNAAKKDSPSDIFACETGYNDAEAEKKREWDLRYERMLRERQGIKEYNMKNSLHYKEKVAFAPVRTESKPRNRYAVKNESMLDLGFAEPDDEQKAEWDRRYDARLKNRNQHPKVSCSRGSVTALPPPAMNQDGPRDSFAAAHSTGRAAGDTRYSHRAQACVPHNGRVTSHGRHAPASPETRQTNGNPYHVPHAPAAPVSQSTTEQSYSKRRRQLKPREANSGVAVHKPRSYQGRYQSPTDFIDEFDRKINEADQLEMRFAVSRAARNEISGTTEAVCDDFVDEFLDDLDDILESPAPATTVSKHKKQKVADEDQKSS